MCHRPDSGRSRLAVASASHRLGQRVGERRGLGRADLLGEAGEGGATVGGGVEGLAHEGGDVFLAPGDGTVVVRAPVTITGDESLVLQAGQDGQDGGGGEAAVGQRVDDLACGDGPSGGPQDLHDGSFQLSKSGHVWVLSGGWRTARHDSTAGRKPRARAEMTDLTDLSLPCLCHREA